MNVFCFYILIGKHIFLESVKLFVLTISFSIDDNKKLFDYGQNIDGESSVTFSESYIKSNNLSRNLNFNMKTKYLVCTDNVNLKYYEINGSCYYVILFYNCV